MEHSWSALMADDAMVAEEPDEVDDLPVDIASLVDKITAGEYDPYIEIFLTLLHSRKRALRNVPGFKRGR